MKLNVSCNNYDRVVNKSRVWKLFNCNWLRNFSIFYSWSLRAGFVSVVLETIFIFKTKAKFTRTGSRLFPNGLILATMVNFFPPSTCVTHAKQSIGSTQRRRRNCQGKPLRMDFLNWYIMISVPPVQKDCLCPVPLQSALEALNRIIWARASVWLGPLGVFTHPILWVVQKAAT